jgi:DNA repair protein RadC
MPELYIKETDGTYTVAPSDVVLDAANVALNRRFRRGVTLTDTEKTREYFRTKLAHREYEVFAILWLDNRHRIIAMEEAFRGTFDGANVYPREVVKSALEHNAAACILAHNHPSGMTEPSTADRRITQRIGDALATVEVRVLDHIIVGEDTLSMRAAGLM